MLAVDGALAHVMRAAQPCELVVSGNTVYSDAPFTSATRETERIPTFCKGGACVFWDVGNTHRAIVVELTGEPYRRLIVEVADPAGEVARFQAAPLT